jgi:mannose-6-phosphate isomerase-like protein (cupin superfamily)
MRHSILVTAVLLSAVGFASVALSQGQRQGGQARPAIPADAATLVTTDQFQTMLKNGPTDKDTGKPAGLSTQLFGRVANCAFIRITAPDSPHAHGDTSEILVIQSGSADFETGGEMVGPFSATSAVHQDMFTNADGTRRPAGTGPGGGTPPGFTGPAGGAAAGGGAGASPAAGGNGGGARVSAGGVDMSVGGPHNGSGSAVAGGKTQHLKAGDIILIPAGVPHHWTKVDEPIVYLDIKFPEAK